MATLKQYTRNLWQVHRTVAGKLGLNVTWGEPEQRVLVIADDVMLAVLLKLLVDKGLVTDAELNAAYNAAASAALPKQPPVVAAPGEDEAPAEPDLGA